MRITRGMYNRTSSVDRNASEGSSTVACTIIYGDLGQMHGIGYRDKRRSVLYANTNPIEVQTAVKKAGPLMRQYMEESDFVDILGEYDELNRGYEYD